MSTPWNPSKDRPDTLKSYVTAYHISVEMCEKFLAGFKSGVVKNIYGLTLTMGDKRRDFTIDELKEFFEPEV